jgi:hypothetical protein
VTCTVDGCDRVHMGRGLCNSHYSRWLRGGDLQLVRTIVMVDAEPLLDAITRRLGERAVTWLIPDDSDRRAYYRAKASGHISEAVADRLCVKVLGRTIDEVY